MKNINIYTKRCSRLDRLVLIVNTSTVFHLKIKKMNTHTHTLELHTKIRFNEWECIEKCIITKLNGKQQQNSSEQCWTLKSVCWCNAHLFFSLSFFFRIKCNLNRSYIITYVRSSSRQWNIKTTSMSRITKSIDFNEVKLKSWNQPYFIFQQLTEGDYLLAMCINNQQGKLHFFFSSKEQSKDFIEINAWKSKI